MLLKRILIIKFLLVLFVGTVGIPVFQHFCKKDGYQASIFVALDHCTDENQPELSCCSEEKSCPMQEGLQENCCEEKVSFIQITQLINDETVQSTLSPFTPAVDSFEPFNLSKQVYKAYNRSYSRYRRPPTLSGFEYCIYFQTFLI
jgi:hypothetical protein